MLQLILVRHAKSDGSLPGQDDWDRPLTPRGLRDAPEMARRLRARKLKPDRMLTSPALRALATATIMARELRFPVSRMTPDERLYLASPADLVAVIRELGRRSARLMVIGHNPGLTECANRLSADDAIDNLPTCGIYTARFDIGDWRELDWGTGEDTDFDYPKKAG